MFAAIFIIIHLLRISISDFLVHRLQPHTSLSCEFAREGLSIEKGHIYVAAPNHHLLIKKDKIILGRGPEETAGVLPLTSYFVPPLQPKS
jgi:two-component system chemotaxis response regulator CheB